MIDISPQEAQYDELGRPMHPVVAAIHNATVTPNYTPVPVQQTPNYTPVPVMNKPDFSPVQVPPAPLTSTQQAVKADTPPDPRDPQYRNSKLRTILNSIGAGLTGAANPQAGIALARDLRDAKYNRAKQAYDVTHGKNLEQEGIEEKNRTAEIEKARLGVTRGAAQSTSDNREELARIRQIAADTQAAREKDYAADNASKDAARKVNEEKIRAQEAQIKQANKEREEKKADLDKIIAEKDLKKQAEMLKQHRALYEKPVTETVSNSPTMAAAVENARTNAAAANPNTRTVANMRSMGAQTGRNEADNPDEDAAVKAMADRAKADPDAWHDIYKEVPTKLKAKFVLATAGDPVPKQLNNQQKIVAGNAKTAINHANTVEEMINNPKIRPYIGPIAGRLSEAGEVIGKSITGTPEEEQLVQSLQSMEKYLITFEASSVAGSRPSWQLIKYLQSSSQMKFDEQRIRGALDAVRKSAANRLKGLYDASSSGQPTQKITPSGLTWKWDK